MRIGLLNNLRAGRSEVQVARLLKCIERHPDILHVETTHAAAVPEALGEFAREGVDVLAVNGGDGTLMRVLTEVIGSGEFDDRALIGANCGFTVDGELVDPKPGRVISVTATKPIRFARA